jgi:hypothetical protein
MSLELNQVSNHVRSILESAARETDSDAERKMFAAITPTVTRQVEAVEHHLREFQRTVREIRTFIGDTRGMPLKAEESTTEAIRQLLLTDKQLRRAFESPAHLQEFVVDCWSRLDRVMLGLRIIGRAITP